MSKYDAVTHHLQRDPTVRVEFAFHDIDRIVGGLPPSASRDRTWWANTKASAQGRAWLAAGRRVEWIDLNQRRVRFTPVSVMRSDRVATAPEPSGGGGGRLDSVGDDRPPGAIANGHEFERHARAVLTAHWRIALESRVVNVRGVTHSFDLVSNDERIIGDAKWFKDLRPIPAAKMSVIAEYVWLLQHLEDVDRRFLVFGQDRAVPERWLKRFAPLAEGIEFWFLQGEHLDRLA